MAQDNPDLQHGSVPVPDPTLLTTEALRRDIGALRELMEARLAAIAKLEDERIKALELRMEWDAARVAEEVKAGHQYYDAILSERDRRYEEQSTAAQRAIEAALDAATKATAAAFDSREKALNAALDAAEKAILKAEVSIEKRADATYVALNELQRMLSALMPRVESDQRFKTIEERHAEVTSRVDRMEAGKVGASEQRSGMHESTRMIMAIGGFIILVLGFIAARGGL